ncbi:hypothetical protein BJ138DRAFT_1172688 [Hygrophoropsis aurantiaca]|uniref:Uncharacterized protein n=1 Tax=Hygrophoropsis aurantiaca TaxID=72124 RepID=A0ACB8AD06_9AGAM|nr:hypothetical protein BJ138DRAFT_1172688 [Hygrophoropsis aurantiaca]
MVSVLPATFSLRTQDVKPELQLNELTNLTDAVESFTSLVGRSGTSVRLHCSVPTWCSSDTCSDLHDLHDLRSRFLLFIHDLLESLRSSGIPASYRLVPSNTSLCFVCALPAELSAPKIRAAAIEILQNAKINVREKILLADLEHGPALIIS